MRLKKMEEKNKFIIYNNTNGQVKVDVFFRK